MLHLGAYSNDAADMRAIFSGRFDPNHLGHWATILEIVKVFAQVNVVILDYPERRFPVSYIHHRFTKLVELSNLERRVFVTTWGEHFAKISPDQAKVFGDIELTGNLEVMRHLDSVGFPVLYIPRSFEDAASLYAVPPH